ncbi:YggS family pyridoxal phosphate-dependent enzyme [Corynebacterium doosanense]|uniref:Pyridoxal phosphate homeostasis protein n=1 Tax=Corynebacterium doosanense CAU 212 = DSM 45436 TaxID=558173 RepID=A0A097IH45_9CORY|nr:YggS family pyridoxal phosphate-dependent enzyme [Corynebacterium doosanense]AIT61456.1 hypothetical protein CDOO_09400 [Corynebacterium doosanense CAU 212 = DSM 45436]
MTRIDDLRTNLSQVRERIAAVEAAAGREAGSVQLLPVTKFHPAADIALLAELGITDVGENREQEARAKSGELPGLNFHMIGQIQTKKANSVARWASACHSVGTVKLVEALDRGVRNALDSGSRTKALECFIQWSVDGDLSRGGAVESDLPELADAVRATDGLTLAGLMVVPPIGADPGEVFRNAKALVDGLGEGLRLSAGMSGDMEAAISSGSDIVRVGTDILGPRPVA